MILVTGGAGYIGSHMALKLLENNEKVVVFDNFSTGHIETIETLMKEGKDNFEFFEGDLLNLNDLNALFKGRNIEAVIHFAAFSLVEESTKNPAKYYKNNVTGSINLLDAMHKYNVNKIVFSSTAATYGEPEEIPIKETSLQNPVNPYGTSKLTVEKIMDDYDRAYGIKSVRLRYFNVAGADSKCRIGENHNPETHLIPNILKSTFNNKKTFKIFGDNYNTKDGTCVRDYINVEDLINAHLLALKYLLAGGKTDFFNLGTNEGNSVKEIFDLCTKVTNKEIPFEIAQKRAGDPAVLIADNKKAKEILGWNPEKTLYDSIKSAYMWELKQNERNKK
ncbi:TPA: UDP-glucose 4-epimerase GalE [Candidatus Galligastranaerophilus gallistercoris]|nr:UDP-glucose 4-epimerase GalE [Candidatus Galligastranaerophilus gallistercoris]